MASSLTFASVSAFIKRTHNIPAQHGTGTYSYTAEEFEETEYAHIHIPCICSSRTITLTDF